MSIRQIFIIDDDEHILEYMNDFLSGQSYEVSAFTSAREAMEKLGKKTPDLVITDVKMDEMTGDEVLRHVKSHSPDTGVIMITAFGNVAHSVNAMQKGVFDYITKPFTGTELLRRVQQFFDHSHRSAAEQASSRAGSNAGTADSSSQDSSESKKTATGSGARKERRMVGENEKIVHLKNILKQIAPTHAPVLIEGESGTGKEVYANLIQQYSTRSKAPFVKINCANLPSELVESTLFGHVKGSFTGAINDYEGAFTKADGGTLLLDEITETDISVQAKLLRVLQEKEFQKVGSQKPEKVDVRIIATTNRNPSEAIKSGEFRQDLYFRLNVFPIRIPPLRERKDDIPLLAAYFCDKYSEEYDLPRKEISDKLKKHLISRQWTGNIRELENYIIRGVIMAQDSDVLKLEHCENGLFNNVNEELTTSINKDIQVMPIEEMELILIKKALDQTNGNQKEAARLLNVTDRTIRNKLKKINFPEE
ncbi:sigma-54-dependent transcriptional regulator [Rhodohalobacter mucosus]|uniref:Sigma-54-dependent Fis family transcriptional regulator n=1 Tax=Rhodohalobacter mucosus TaxID=2079485 RepID=A0A316TQC4_9BACT|nr:sigma-54 dependent transcriptional regulator [Rhodohalobacter mucosus]PWN05205.1 sigma-54-dependent Fis family transcriptional regulator [Rhodohalobacter mucosus]